MAQQWSRRERMLAIHLVTTPVHGAQKSIQRGMVTSGLLLRLSLLVSLSICYHLFLLGGGGNHLGQSEASGTVCVVYIVNDSIY